MIVTFSGTAGSGKSTVARKLADKLGWPRYYIGGIRRQKAKERGMTLDKYNRLGETDPATDKEVDEYQKHLGETRDNFIIEGRTSWYLIPHSLKIFLSASEEVGAKRIWGDLKKNDQRNESGQVSSLAEVRKNLRLRQQSDETRYRKYYGVDMYNMNNFDLVLDTTDLTPEQAFAKVYDFVRTRLKHDKK